MGCELNGQTPRSKVLAHYKDALDYDIECSVEKAKTVIKAGRILLATPIRRSESQARGEAVEIEPRIIQEEVDKAVLWWRRRALGGSGSIGYITISDYRGAVP